MDLSGFYNHFRDEVTENIRILSDGLLALEQMSDSDAPDTHTQLNAIFRAMHTIKGSARLLGFETVGRLAHTMENVLGAVRAGHQAIDRALADDLLRGGDAILELTTAAIEDQPISIDIDRLIAQLDHSLVGSQSQEQQRTLAAEPGISVTDTAHTSPRQHVSAPSSTQQSVPESQQTPASIRPHARSHSRPTNRQTVRVRVDRLDRLINLTGELVTGQQVVTGHGQTLHELTAVIQRQERALLELDAELRNLRFSPSQQHILDSRLETLFHTSDQTRQILNHQIEQFSQHINQQGLLLGDLEQEVMAARLLPVATVYANLPRAVRELARATNKEVILHLQGETTEMDRKLIEMLNDPLLHLVRNAIDHGIEPSNERIALKKPPQGSVSISAEAVGSEVRICVSDDGCGIQPDHIRDIAVRKGLISAENAALLSEQEALELIFLPGFSTTPIITDISGRGVGLDVVRTNIGELGGQVLLESQPGCGTQITLLLPLTLVTTRIVLVTIGTHTFALPASGCYGTIWTHRSNVRTLEGRATIVHKEQTLPLLPLAELLGIEASPAFNTCERLPTILVGSTKRLLGLLVDQLLDEREAVVKSLGPLFEHRQRYSGAIQLGNGQLVLLLNPAALAQAARGMGTTNLNLSPGSTGKGARLLVVDDSFTTRELIRSILQAAGYHVTVAVDGLDALDKLRAQSYELVISDVEMPRVNGFQLTSRIRRELRLSDLPVVIITSLASDEHRRKGLEAGAQAYIVKSQFNQDNLLEVVQQLLGHEH